MKKFIKIKDPIFGYIIIEDKNLFPIIDSAMFHRLHDIIQTSYPSVYPSAAHTRFTHSLGVYHLGKIAVKKLIIDILNQKLAKRKDLEILSCSFLLACLLHDIGHSPFSHTGEKFYFQNSSNGKTPKIWQRLLKAIKNSKNFIKDSNGLYVGAEHEIMSALVSLLYFKPAFEQLDKEFFVRCIIGLKYSNKNDIKNCFIDLLNSKTIDVDKLDYLIRDSFITGFKNVNIDYERLLNGVCVIKDEDGISLGFEKSALSTLENVILAHDMEKKWIQNHPVIKYESYLISYMISKVQDLFIKNGVNIFSPEALTEKGLKTGDNKICLLSDSDIYSVAKTFYSEDSIIKEFFNRSLRKKALWKSEAEYRIYFEQRGLTNDPLAELESQIRSLENMIINKFDIPVINNKTLNYLKSELKNTAIPNNIRKVKNIEIKKVIELIDVLKQYSVNNRIPFEYMVINANQFSTGFNKTDFKRIKIRFPENTITQLDSVLYLFNTKEPRENFFYLYALPQGKEKINVKKLTLELVKFILKKYNTSSK